MLIFIVYFIQIFKNTTTGQCSDGGYRTFPISRKVLSCGISREFAPLHTIASILQAYSTVALVATENATAPEGDRRTMQVVHELLNVLVQTYFDVVSTNPSCMYTMHKLKHTHTYHDTHNYAHTALQTLFCSSTGLS